MPTSARHMNPAQLTNRLQRQLARHGVSALVSADGGHRIPRIIVSLDLTDAAKLSDFLTASPPRA